MLLVSGTVRQEGAWEDPSPLEGWTSLVLAPWVVPWARNFPNFWPVYQSRGAPCALQAQIVSEVSPCCSSGTHILHYSLFLWFCKGLRSASGSLQFSECACRTVHSSDCPFLGHLGMLQICNKPCSRLFLVQALLLVVVPRIWGTTGAWLSVIWLHRLCNPLLCERSGFLSGLIHI